MNSEDFMNVKINFWECKCAKENNMQNVLPPLESSQEVHVGLPADVKNDLVFHLVKSSRTNGPLHSRGGRVTLQSGGLIRIGSNFGIACLNVKTFKFLINRHIIFMKHL